LEKNAEDDSQGLEMRILSRASCDRDEHDMDDGVAELDRDTGNLSRSFPFADDLLLAKYSKLFGVKLKT